MGTHTGGKGKRESPNSSATARQGSETHVDHTYRSEAPGKPGGEPEPDTILKATDIPGRWQA